MSSLPSQVQGQELGHALCGVIAAEGAGFGSPVWRLLQRERGLDKEASGCSSSYFPSTRSTHTVRALLVGDPSGHVLERASWKELRPFSL